jgi:hypothetical protein
MSFREISKQNILYDFVNFIELNPLFLSILVVFIKRVLSGARYVSYLSDYDDMYLVSILESMIVYQIMRIHNNWLSVIFIYL